MDVSYIFYDKKNASALRPGHFSGQCQFLWRFSGAPARADSPPRWELIPSARKKIPFDEKKLLGYLVEV
jgi:hypothetical protein